METHVELHVLLGLSCLPRIEKDVDMRLELLMGNLSVVDQQVLRDWIIKPNLGKINMEAYLRDITTMKIVSNGFAQRSNSLLQGAISAIDG